MTKVTPHHEGRSVPEWVGASPDSPIPDRVKLRIWEREKGECHISGRKIQPGDSYEFEHEIPLSRGGENRETNIRLALTEPHKEKSAEERDLNAVADRKRKKHLGIWKSKTPFRRQRNTAEKPNYWE